MPSQNVTTLTNSTYTSNIRPELQRRIDEQRHAHDAQFKEMSLTADDLNSLANEVEKGNIEWKRLDFFNNQIGANGCSHIRRILRVLPLTYLHLGVNHIGPEGVTHLTGLHSNYTLTELDLWDNAIGDDGARTLSHFFPHTRLQRVNLGVNSIGDRGCSALVPALPSTLTYLNLYANKMSMESHNIIIDLINSRRTQLAELNLEATPISSVGNCKDEIRTAGASIHCKVLI
jgi:Ran GTPase-activating protein (RanGAP) involved in mRNA processing and transport